MSRITISNLRALCATLNRVTGSPATYWHSDTHTAAIGHFHIGQAYGGYSLRRTMNESGGITDPLSSGHIPARDLYERMHAFMRGIELGRELERSEARHGL